MKTHDSPGVLSLFRSHVMVAVAACLATWPVGAQPSSDLAQQIIDESGFQGGLIILVGEWDADLAVSLGRAPNVLVHWLVRDGMGLEEGRRAIRDAGIYGRVSAMIWEDSKLPYADDTVNLLVLQHDEEIRIDQSEVHRVLAPKGVEIRFRGSIRTGSYRRKPWPVDVDVWTHSRRDASGNAFSEDQRAGLPRPSTDRDNL